MKRWFPLLVVFCAGFAHAALVEESSTTTATLGIAAMTLNASDSLLYVAGISAFTVLNGTGTQTTPLQSFVVGSSVTVSQTQVYISTYVDVSDRGASAVALDDPARHRIYFAFGQSSATLVALDDVSFVQIASVTIPDSFGRVGTGLLDSSTSYLYLGSTSNPAQILKVDVTNLALISSITLTAPFGNLRSAALDSMNHFAYFGSSAAVVGGPGGVTKIKLADFTFVNSLSFPNGVGGAVSAFIDPNVGYAWFGTDDFPGNMVRIQLSNFSLAGSVSMHAGDNRLTTAIYDPATRLAYFGTNLSTAVIVAADPIHMAWKSDLLLASGQAFLFASAIDTVNHYGYFGTSGNSGHILKIDLIGGKPDITASPSDQDVPVGQPATFGVIASGRNLSYQWKRNGVAIDSATSTTYQLAITTLNDDGAQFLCTVSDDAGSSDSGIATLTVQPDVHVYPQPWRADRDAGIPLRFNGLPTGATVKIFTTAAQWVRSVPESGGVAAWDLKTDGGRQAASGYYFYYVQTPSNRQQIRGKFALIR